MTRDFQFEEVRACIAHISRLFLVSDFDGTLAPIASSPEVVSLPQHIAERLRLLNLSPKVVLAIISGRRLQDVKQRVALPAFFGGNHGLELSGPGIDFVHPQVGEFTERLNRVCNEVTEDIAMWPGAWVENKVLTATVHFREVPSEQWPMLISTARMRIANHQEAFDLRSGHAALEITPRVAWDKGSALKYLREKLSLQHAFTICLGDDTTDESMFRAAPDGITIRVGRVSHTEASYCMPGGVDEVAAFLHQLSETIGTPPPPSVVWRTPRSGVIR